MPGIRTLEENIARLEAAMAETRQVIREAHESVQAAREERKQIEQLLDSTAKELVDKHISKIVIDKLDRIGPELEKQSAAIYDKVGREVDRLIDLCMGAKFARDHGREDLRPALAAKLSTWLQEIISEETP